MSSRRRGQERGGLLAKRAGDAGVARVCEPGGDNAVRITGKGRQLLGKLSLCCLHKPHRFSESRERPAHILDHEALNKHIGNPVVSGVGGCARLRRARVPVGRGCGHPPHREGASCPQSARPAAGTAVLPAPGSEPGARGAALHCIQTWPQGRRCPGCWDTPPVRNLISEPGAAPRRKLLNPAAGTAVASPCA